jgi:hypothetical protein
MATSAKGSQVQVVIIALLTAQSLVMHMQILSGTADLGIASHHGGEPVF